MDLASGTTPGVLVVDRSGAVFSLLRSLNLGVPLWRITTAAEADHADISLTVVATYEQTDWELIGELADNMTTVILTTNPSPSDAAHAVAMGVFGYVDTHLPSEALRRSILGALRGEHAYSRRILSTLIKNGRWLRASNALPLTPRQREVVMLIARGAADKEIARSLGITTATAQKHVTNLLRRLNVPNRAAAVAVMSSAYPQ
ncbi:MAG: response regulator transcription factor [Chloroflexota bacterium]